MNSCTFYLYNSTCIIENKTSDSLQVNVFANIYCDSTNIIKNNIDTLYSGLDTDIIKPFNFYDSVIFIFSNDKVLKYYPTDTLNSQKSFFREEDWILEKPSRQTYVYKFTITEEDLE